MYTTMFEEDDLCLLKSYTLLQEHSQEDGQNADPQHVFSEI